MPEADAKLNKAEQTTSPEDTVENDDSVEKATESNSKKDKQKTKKPWYKNKKKLGIIAAIALVAAGLGLWLTYRANTTNNKAAISDGWHAIVQQSQKVVTIGDKIKTADDYSEYSKELHNLDTVVNDKKYATAKLPSSLTNKAELDSWNKFLNDFGAYGSKAASESDKVSDFSAADYDALKELSTAAKATAQNFRDGNSYISEDMPAQIWDIATVLDTIKTTIDTKKAEEETAKEKAAAAEAQDASDKATVDANVNVFQTAFIAANSTTMKTVMSSGFISEYDFTQITPAARKYNYPDSYRIIDSTKTANGNYEVRVNTVFKQRGDDGVVNGQYTSGSTFTLITSGSTWLVNSEKVEGAY